MELNSFVVTEFDCTYFCCILKLSSFLVLSPYRLWLLKLIGRSLSDISLSPHDSNISVVIVENKELRCETRLLIEHAKYFQALYAFQLGNQVKCKLSCHTPFSACVCLNSVHIWRDYVDWLNQDKLFKKRASHTCLSLNSHASKDPLDRLSLFYLNSSHLSLGFRNP